MPNIPPLIGLGGRLASGKDTAADYLVTHHGYTKLGMSDPLAHALRILDPYVPNADYGQSQSRADPENGVSRYSDLLASKGYTEAKTNPEVRRLLQTLGTEIGRNLLHPDTWVNVAHRTIATLLAQGTPVVITGMRFPNELRMVHDLGGTTVWVDRPTGTIQSTDMAFLQNVPIIPTHQWPNPLVRKPPKATEAEKRAERNEASRVKQGDSVANSLARSKAGREALQGMADSTDPANEPSNDQVRNNEDQRQNNAHQARNDAASRRSERERYLDMPTRRTPAPSSPYGEPTPTESRDAAHERARQARNAHEGTTAPQGQDPGPFSPGILGAASQGSRADGRGSGGQQGDATGHQAAAHASEVSLTASDFDRTLLNSGSLDTLYANVERLIAGLGSGDSQ